MRAPLGLRVEARRMCFSHVRNIAYNLVDVASRQEYNGKVFIEVFRANSLLDSAFHLTFCVTLAVTELHAA